MKANELRIGNLTTVGKVIEIHEDYFYVHDGESSLKSSWFDIQPIPLNEEWLLKFGFEKHFINDSEIYFYRISTLSHGNISFYFNSKGFNCDLGTTSGYHFGTTQIKHVHQLQNLYWCLTNEELTLKP